MNTQTESIEISGLPPGTTEAIEEVSRSKGKSAEEYLRTLIEAEILSEKNFSEILTPIRRSFRDSGMTDQQLDDLFNDALNKVRRKDDANRQ